MSIPKPFSVFGKITYWTVHISSIVGFAGEVKKDLKYQYKESIMAIVDIPSIR